MKPPYSEKFISDDGEISKMYVPLEVAAAEMFATKYVTGVSEIYKIGTLCTAPDSMFPECCILVIAYYNVTWTVLQSLPKGVVYASRSRDYAAFHVVTEKRSVATEKIMLHVFRLVIAEKCIFTGIHSGLSGWFPSGVHSVIAEASSSI